MVKRLSVSVLVNDQTKAGKAAPISAAQLAQMKQLVENAIGFDTKRGDTVSVVNMPFTAAQTEAEKALPVWRQPWIWDGVRQAVPYVIALILGLMAYRAMRKAATGGGRRPKGGAAEPALASADSAPAGSEPGSTGLGAGFERAAAGMPGALAPDTVHLSNTLETDAAISRELVKQDPRRAAQVVKEWLSDGQ